MPSGTNAAVRPGGNRPAARNSRLSISSPAPFSALNVILPIATGLMTPTNVAVSRVAAGGSTVVPSELPLSSNTSTSTGFELRPPYTSAAAAEIDGENETIVASAKSVAPTWRVGAFGPRNPFGKMMMPSPDVDVMPKPGASWPGVKQASFDVEPIGSPQSVGNGPTLAPPSKFSIVRFEGTPSAASNAASSVKNWSAPLGCAVLAFASVETASATAAASAIDFDRFIAATPNMDETASRFGCREHLHDEHAGIPLQHR